MEIDAHDDAHVAKVTVIGAGHVGATTAQRIVEGNLADVVMIDIVEGLAAGKALDMNESSPILGFNSRITGSSDSAAMKDSDIVVVTAGVARKPGMSRDDLLGINTKIISEIAGNIKTYAPHAIVIMVTNPLDAMAYLMLKVTGFESRKVIGMAGELDTARFSFFIAEALNITGTDVQAVILGGHGDTMVPLPEHTTVKGLPLTNFLKEKEIAALVERTVNGGAEVVSLLKTGSAFYAPSAAVVKMVKAILREDNTTVCASAYLQGEYGIEDVYLGVPLILGKNGIEKIITLPLSDKAKEKLKRSAETVATNRDKLSF